MTVEQGRQDAPFGGFCGRDMYRLQQVSLSMRRQFPENGRTVAAGFVGVAGGAQQGGHPNEGSLCVLSLQEQSGYNVVDTIASGNSK